MSVVGTSIVSSIAQTPVQSQQTAGQRDRVDSETAREARDIRDLFQSHIRAVEEDETDPDATSNPRIAEQLPESQGSTQTRKDRDKRRQAFTAAAGDAGGAGGSDSTASAPAPPSGEPDSPLYRHLDVQG